LWNIFLGAQGQKRNQLHLNFQAILLRSPAFFNPKCESRSSQSRTRMTPNSSKWNAELSPSGPSLKVLVNHQEDKNGLVRSKFLRPRILFTKQEDKNELASQKDYKADRTHHSDYQGLLGACFESREQGLKVLTPLKNVMHFRSRQRFLVNDSIDTIYLCPFPPTICASCDYCCYVWQPYAYILSCRHT